MKSGPIAIIGGGVFVPRLCHALAACGEVPPAEIRLMARRYDRLSVIADAAQQCVDRVASGWKVRAAGSIEQGCAEAEAVVLLLREGGLAARAKDETFPRAFGLTGDEGLGAGGMANALRTIPALRQIAPAIARAAPGAWILNMVAPLGLTTRFLLDTGLRAIGLCELPAVTERRLTAAGRIPPAALHYAGFNHLGWFWTADENRAELARASVEAGLADPDIVAAFGAVPLRYYYEIFRPDKAERLGFQRSPTRARDLMKLSEGIFGSLLRNGQEQHRGGAERHTPWFEHALIPVLAALTGGRDYDGFLNLRNADRLPMVSPDVVVEVRARISASAVETGNSGPPPPKVASFFTALGKSEDCVYRAASTSDPAERAAAIHAALGSLPLPFISGKLKQLADEILEAGGAMAEATREMG